MESYEVELDGKVGHILSFNPLIIHHETSICVQNLNG